MCVQQLQQHEALALMQPVYGDVSLVLLLDSKWCLSADIERDRYCEARYRRFTCCEPGSFLPWTVWILIAVYALLLPAGVSLRLCVVAAVWILIAVCVGRVTVVSGRAQVLLEQSGNCSGPKDE